MYERDTVLTLKTPRWRPLVDGEPGDWQAEEYDTFKSETEALAEGDAPVGEEFPYNRVRVINASPITHAGGDRGDWTGADTAGVIIEPITSFGGNVDYPFGYLRSVYDVESIPEPVVVSGMAYGLPTQATAARPGPTPEEVFLAEAPGPAPEEGQIRARTPLRPNDPLGDVAGTVEKTFDPLGASA